MIIYVPTIQGTGTFFTIDLIRDQQPMKYYHLYNSERILENVVGGVHLVHTHFGEKEGIRPDNAWIVPFSKAEEWLGRADRIVMPIRDPETAIMTGITTRVNPIHIIERFVFAARWAEKYEIFFLTIDLLANSKESKRLSVLKRFMDFLWLPGRTISVWAKNWPVVNHRGRSSLSNLFEYQYLIENEEILRPFLESLGYRNLSWWS